MLFPSIKSVEAPKWWILDLEKVAVFENEVGDIIGKKVWDKITKERDEMAHLSAIGKLSVEDEETKALELKLEIAKNMKGVFNSLSVEQLAKANTLQKHIHDLVNVMWSKFRLENLNNEFGRADQLIFDPTTNLITISKEES